MAAFLSAIIFNEGWTPILRLMEVMGIVIGPQANAAADARDHVRVRKAEVVHTAASKEGRLSRRMEQSAQNEFFEEEESGLYGPGIAD